MKPLTPGMLRKWHLKPAAKKAEVSGNIGWHTFRRTLASLFIAALFPHFQSLRKLSC
jgi:hypothetical protein